MGGDSGGREGYSLGLWSARSIEIGRCESTRQSWRVMSLAGRTDLCRAQRKGCKGIPAARKNRPHHRLFSAPRRAHQHATRRGATGDAAREAHPRAGRSMDRRASFALSPSALEHGACSQPLLRRQRLQIVQHTPAAMVGGMQHLRARSVIRPGLFLPRPPARPRAPSARTASCMACPPAA